MEGGHLGAIVQPTAALIVLGGTLGATLVSSPRDDLARASSLIKRVFAPTPPRAPRLIRELSEMAARARKDGVISLEQTAANHPDPSLRFAIQYLVDGVPANQLREVLETEAEIHSAKQIGAARVFEVAGGYAPTFGILGAVIGLIHVMENLQDEHLLGAGIAVAFCGHSIRCGSRKSCFLTAGKNGSDASQNKTIGIYQLIADGMLAIQAGQNPRMVEDRLRLYLREPGKSSRK